MRLGVLWEIDDVGGELLPLANAYYRAIDPMGAMARRGHEIVWPGPGRYTASAEELLKCDVVHVYRTAVPQVRQALTWLTRQGVALVYDNDDDFTSVPKESPGYRETGGIKGQRIFAETAKLARMARRCTTTTDRLAEKYRQAGVERVEVIPNHLAPDLERPTRRHDGVVIGWVAAGEHRTDANRIEIGQALSRLMERYDEVSVHCIGMDLGLSGRYRYDNWFPFPELPRHVGGWDVGIAPLADTAWNRARSDIKVKEYAASGLPWLASPVGPYAGLGEAQGGLLVPDDGWLEALERLVTRRRERRRLARKARAWAGTQTIEAVADRWERVFREAASA